VVSLGGLPLGAGTVLAKKYRVDGLIGEGGTGIVVSAWHLQLEQKVAIKFLRTALANDEVRLRFEREARAIGQIESEHVVVVFDVGATDDGAPYMVMEYLEGKDLARHLKQDGPLAVPDAVDCMLQVCEALAQAHAAGVVHRDLKPGNLFLTRRDDGAPHVKVVDFGISKILDKKLLAGSPKEVTNAFSVLGSPRYMAPEQLRNSKDVDARTDLWSVGAVLYQLVSGKYAFDGDTNVAASVKVLSAEPLPLRQHAPTVVAELEAVIAKCLCKDREGRFQTAADLTTALLPFASDRGRESLERIAFAKEAPSLEIALSLKSQSEPPVAHEAQSAAGADAVGPSASPPAKSQFDVPTSPRAFKSSIPPPLGKPVEVDAGGKIRVPFRLLVALGTVLAVGLAFGVMALAKTFAESAGLVRPAGSDDPAAFVVAPRPTVAREPAVVPLDAGRRAR
jgi:serine/threonine-protein kinase